MEKCKNLIDMKVKDAAGSDHYRIFLVYGPPDFDERQINDILYHYEKEGGNVRDVRKINGFKSFVEGCNFCGYGF